jgi:hypothetical protein
MTEKTRVKSKSTGRSACATTAPAPQKHPESKKRTSEGGRCKGIKNTGLGIGDLTEDGGALCAGSGREIGGAVVEGFVGEEGEGVGFFGLFGDVEMRGLKDLDGIC